MQEYIFRFFPHVSHVQLKVYESFDGLPYDINRDFYIAYTYYINNPWIERAYNGQVIHLWVLLAHVTYNISSLH